MIPIAELAAYRDIPVFGWLSNEESLDDKTKLQTLVRSIAPLSSIGTMYNQIIYNIHYFRKLLFLLLIIIMVSRGRGCDITESSYTKKFCLCM